MNYIKWRKEDLQSVSCDYCGSDYVKVQYMRADGMQVTECARCGLAYLNPRPHDNLIYKLYDESYFSGKSAEKGIGLRLTLDLNNKKNKCCTSVSFPRPIELLRNKVGNLKGMKVLEVGCATGDLLEMFRRKAALVNGLEVSEFAAQFARNRGFNVTTGTIDIYSRNHSNAFDIIVALEVIEHVLSPSKFLTYISETLSSGGYFLLSTPNYACAQRFGSDWFGFKTSFEHIWYFNIDILKEMALSSNLELIYWETNLFSGGQNISLSIVQRYHFKVKKWFKIIYHFGLIKTIRMRQKAPLSFCPHGDGHTLFALFKKKDNVKV